MSTEKNCLETADTIRMLRCDKVKLLVELANKERATTVQKDAIKGIILSLKDEKDKPLFSNESARNAEISNRLNSDKEYCNLLDSISQNKQAVSFIDADIELQLNYLKIYLTDSRNCPFQK